MKKIVFGIFLVAIAAAGINATMIEKDPLHGKTFEVMHTEYKDSLPKPSSKPIKDEIMFKNGKLFSDLAAEKLKFDKMMKYDIKKDSTYTEEDEERHYYEIEASSENDDGQTLIINIKIDDISIEGSMKLSKGDKLKKHYEFTGKEKPKKGKK
jgi:hypothetical protein